MPYRYLGDERFQLALQVGLGMNIMGGDDFVRQQGARSADSTARSPPTPEPKASGKPREVLPQLAHHMHGRTEGQHSQLEGFHAVFQACAVCNAACFAA